MDRVLCAANAQSMKFFFNEEQFAKIPEQVKQELKIICVTYCASAGGVMMMVFDDKNHLHLQTIDPIDEIGAELEVKRMQQKNAELFAQLEMFAEKFPG